HGLPWRNWLFGHVGQLSRWGCDLAPVSTWAARNWLGRWLADKLLGIDSRRPVPAFVRHSLVHRFLEGGREALLESSGDILLFPDTFTTYHEPDIGLAAVEILEELGRTPLLGLPAAGVMVFHDPAKWPMNLICCGRPFISNGMLAHAVSHAR